MSSSSFQLHLSVQEQERAAKLEDFNAELTRTHDAITVLLRRCALINRERNAILPAINLPPEVLATIIEFFCFSEGGHDEDDYTSTALFSPDYEPREGNHFTTFIGKAYWKSFREHNDDRVDIPRPLLIGRVCSKWRQVVQSASHLWTGITLTVNVTHARQQAAVLRYWLSRSGQRVLNVGLRDGRKVPGYYDADEKDMPIAVIQVLCSYAHRLRTVELFPTETWAPILTQFASKASILTRLVLHSSVYRYYSHRFDFFAQAPLLQDVTLFGKRHDFFTTSLPEQIERLTFSHSNDRDPIENLRLYPHLLYCHHMLDPQFPLWSVLMPLTHATLQQLRVTVLSIANAETLFGALTLPNLRSFKLSLLQDVAGAAVPIVPSLLPFFTRSACALQTLHICGVVIPEHDLAACLRAFPTLRDLRLENSTRAGRISARILDLMNPRKVKHRCLIGNGVGSHSVPNEQCLLPNLETFFYKGGLPFKFPVFVEFLADRWDFQHDETSTDGQLLLNTPVARLRKAVLKVEFTKTVDTNNPTLRRLVEEGMDIAIVKTKLPK
ncbi:hypothetical protein BDN70DRAFT_103620 [Pholiota conissans]|uniref:F-box domain-containing protein n=1 Tax=Pholiota conissans TaxID=109636 RepID=A0A9P5ZBU2_9AGAR|nr:hypothetical protein BDN70DRAFT_103620 [Pholiota conissans]